MTAAGRLELAAQARDNVARVIALLARPGVAALQESGAELATAVARMLQVHDAVLQVHDAGLHRAELHDSGSGGGTALKSSVLALRSDLGRARLLLSHAWEFRVGLTGQAGYTDRGTLTTPLATAGRCLFEG
jgi:hypothetical protein